MGGSAEVTGVIVADDDSVIRDILRAKMTDLGQDVFQPPPSRHTSPKHCSHSTPAGQQTAAVASTNG